MIVLLRRRADMSPITHRKQFSLIH